MTRSLILALLALAGCASAPPALETGAQCIQHRHGKATVTATGVVVDEGRCTEWRIGPTRREALAFDLAHPK